MPIAEDVVVIRPDFSRFSSELTSGLANLPAAEIKLEADLKGLGADLVERIGEAASEAGAVFAEALLSAIASVSVPPLEVTADTSGFASSLGDFAPIDVPIHTDTEAATAEIEALLASLASEAATIELDADSAAALSAIADVVDNIPGVDIELNVDTSAFDAAIEDALGDAPELEIGVTADTSSLDGLTSSLDSESVVIGVEADTSAAASEIDALRGSVEGEPVKMSVTGTESANANLSQLVKLAQSAKGGISGVTTELGKMAGAAGPAGAAIAAAGAVGAVSFGAARDAAVVAREAVAVFGDAVKELETVSFDGFTGSLQAAGEALGVDDEELKRFATSVGRVLEGSGVAAEKFAAKLANIAPQLAAIAIEAGSSLSQVESLIETAVVRGGARAEIGLKKLNIPVELDGLDTAEERANAVFAAIENKGGDSFENISTASERSFERFTAKLGNIAEVVGAPLLDIGSAIADSLGTGLEAVAPLAAGLAELAGPALKVVGIFTGFGTATAGLKLAAPAFEAIGSAMGTVADFGGAAADVVADIASGIADFASSTVVESLGSVKEFFSSVADFVLPDGIGDFISGIGDSIGAVVDVLQSALPEAIEQFQSALQEAIDIADKVAGPLANFPDDVFNAKTSKMAEGVGKISAAAAEVSKSVISVEVTGQEQLEGLTGAINSIAERDLGKIEARFGIDIDTTALDTVDEKIAAVGQGIAASVAQNFPDLGETFKDVFSKDGIQSLDEFIAEANQRAADFAQFGSRIKELTAAGFGDLAGFLAQQGPAAFEAMNQLFDENGSLIIANATKLGAGINSALATTFNGLIDLAKAGISGVEDALGGAVGAEIAVKLGLDQSEVVSDFAAVKAQFQADPILAKVSADLDPGVLTKLQTELGGAAFEFDARFKTDPEAAKAELGASIDTALASLPEKTFKTAADREAAKQSLFDAITSATQTAQPAEIKAKLGQLDPAGLEQFQAYVTAHPVTVPVSIRSELRGWFGAQSEQVITAKVEGGGEVEKLREQIDGLKDRKVEVTVDTGQAVGDTRAVGTALDGLKDKRVEVTSTAGAAVKGVKDLADAVNALPTSKSINITVNKVGDANATGASKGGIFEAVNGGVFVNLAEGGFREGVITTDPRYRTQMEAYIRQLGFGRVLDFGPTLNAATAAATATGSASSLNLAGLGATGGDFNLYPEGRAAAASFAAGVAAGARQSASPLAARATPAELGYDAGFEAATGLAEAIKAAEPAVAAAVGSLATAVGGGSSGAGGPVGAAFGSLAERARAAGVTIFDTANEIAVKLGVKVGYQKGNKFATSTTANELASILGVDVGGYSKGGKVSISTTDSELARAILGVSETQRQVAIGNDNNALREANHAAHNMGAAVRAGFSDGLGDGYGAGARYAREVAGGVEDYWQIASPSKRAEGIGRNVAAGFNAGVDKGLDSELLAAIASDSQFTSALAASARSESQILATIAAQYRASQFTMLDRLGLTTPTTTTNTTASTETVVNHNNIENNLSFTAPYADVRLLADEVVRRFGQLARQPS
jgi:hypothetical protein